MRNLYHQILPTVLLTGMFVSSVAAQSHPIHPIQSSLAPLASASGMGRASTGQQAGSNTGSAAGSTTRPATSNQPPEPAASGSIAGTVTAPDGNVIPGAQVSLSDITLKSQRTQITNSEGVFQFTGLNAGIFRLTVTSSGFSAWTGPDITLNPGQSYQQPQIVLAIASTTTTVTAVFAGHDLAQSQVNAQEKQRVLGVFPNFYTSYIWNAQPLTSGQKFHLALRTSIDPVTFLGTGVFAGIQQWQDDFSGYGQGAQGYAKRYGATYANGFSAILLGGAIFPSILHQDPRYFYKGTGTVLSRTLYAISTVVICKGDNGNWQPNYSNVLGNFAAGGISNLYYPSTDRGLEVTLDNALLSTAGGAASSLLQEFLLRKISRGVSPRSKTQQ